MSEDKRLKKNKKISETRKATAEKRSRQMPLTIKLKVNNSRLNEAQKVFLKMIFVEAKWSHNWLLSKMEETDEEKKINIFSFDSKNLTNITHKDKHGNDVEVTLQHLGSSIKDSLVDEIKKSIKSLSTKKKKGNKVGKLKYQSDHSSLFLKQYGITHEIKGNRFRIQGCKKPLPVSGLKQLDKISKKLNIDYELSTATITHINDMYFINLTIWVDKEEYYIAKEKNNKYTNEQIGLDLGCSTTLTSSDGKKVTVLVEESERLKRLQRKKNHQKKGSSNRYRTRKLIKKEYYKLSCLKDNAANQLCSRLLKDNREIIMQDEQIKSWKKKHGKKVQHSILGRIKKILSGNIRVHVLNRFVPTTKFCFDCGHIHNDIELWDRQFDCPNCGCKYDRDVHAALNMIWLFNNLFEYVGVDGSEFKREDFDTAVSEFKFGNKCRRMNHEDAGSSDQA